MTQSIHLTSRVACALALCLGSAAAAHADRPASGAEPRPISDARPLSAAAIARSHWQAISHGEVSVLMEDYSPAAVFHWKEGAFEGDHIGAAAIRAVWIKFARIRSPLTLTVQNVQEKSGRQGSHIVTAEVTFRNAHWTYPLAYRLVFRGDKIVEETWQLAEPDRDPVLLGV